MITPLIQLVRSQVQETWFTSAELVYVFPSEVAASYGAMDLARYGDLGSIQTSRFISWDSFKEMVFRGQELRKPANALVRSLFAESFLQKNSILAREHPAGDSTEGGTCLGAFIPRDFAQEYSGFVQPLVRMLPGLGILFKNHIITSIENTMDRVLLEDYRFIWQAYTHFLDQQGYYEPSWIDEKTPVRNMAGCIFFPELLEDWGEFKHALGLLQDLTTRSLPPLDSPPELLVFQNQAEEMGWILDRVEQLLESGLRPGEIVISLGGYDDCLPALEREAALRSIPLEGRRGRPLSAFGGPGLFRKLQSLSPSNYSFENLESLFMTPAIPWAPGIREDITRLLRLGVECNLGFTSLNIWTWAIATHVRDEETRSRLTDLMRKIQTCTNRLTKASSFSKLQTEVEFVLRLLVSHSDHWSPVDKSALQRSREILNSLGQTEESLGLSVKKPLEFWLSRLDESLYVPQGTRGVIEVYPYRVGAAIPVRAHLVVNANQRDLGVTTGSLSFLRDDQLELLGPEVFRNLTGDFLLAYCQSGMTVELSASEKTFAGVRVPATWFLEHGTTKFCQWPREGTDLGQRGLAYSRGIQGTEYFEAQQGRFLASNLGTWDREYLAQRFHQSPYRNESLLKISNRQLQDYAGCGLNYVLSHGLRIRSRDWKPLLGSPRAEGIVYHEILETFFRKCRDEDRGAWNGSLLHDQYLPSLKEITWQVAGRTFPGQIAVLIRQHLLDNITHLIQQLATHIPFGSLVSFEDEWLRHTDLVWEGLELVLTGRIDGIFTQGSTGKTVVFDFKRSLSTNHTASSLKKLVSRYAQGLSLQQDQGESAENWDDSAEGAEGADGAEGSGIDDESRQKGFQLQLLVYSLLLYPAQTLGPLYSPEPDWREPAWTGNPELLGALCYGAFHLSNSSKPEKMIERVYHNEPKEEAKYLCGLPDLEAGQGVIRDLLNNLRESLEQGSFAEPSAGCPSCSFRGICRTKFALQARGVK